MYIKAEVWDFPVMTERTRLISYLLYGILSFWKNRKRFPANDQRDHSRSCSPNRENPGRAIETRRDSRSSFFENDLIFVFIMYTKILGKFSTEKKIS